MDRDRAKGVLVGWQDELSSLDEEFSSGRIAADEYRRRRDEILAAVSSNPVSLRRRHRQSPGIAGAFTGDAKRIEREAQQAQQARPVATWQSEPPVTGPPVTGPPPPVPHGQPVPKAGAEVFGLAAPARTSSRRWLKPVAGVLVIALVAALTWWLIASRTSSPPDPAAGTPTVPAPSGAPKILSALPKLPGVLIDEPAMVPVGVGAQLGLYTPELARQVDKTNGPGMLNAASVDGFKTYGVAALSAPEYVAPLSNVLGYHVAVGWKYVTDTKVPQKLQVFQPPVQAQGQQIMRAVYQSGEWTVIITGSTLDPDRPQFVKGFEQVVDSVVAALPPTN